MDAFSDKLIRRLRQSDPLTQIQLIAESSLSPATCDRVAAGAALATQNGEIGAPTAVQHLSEDLEEDVRIAALEAAATRLERNPRAYVAVLRRCGTDPSRRVRRVAIAGMRKCIELGVLWGIAPALLGCARITDPTTQALAIEALGELARVAPRRGLDAFTELVENRDEIDVELHDRLARAIESLRASGPRRTARLLRRLRDPALESVGLVAQDRHI